jgi:hypothetical protein
MSAFLDALMKLSVQFLSKQSPLRNMVDLMAEQSALLQHECFPPSNGARVQLEDWQEEVMHAERTATEASPQPK